MNASRELDALVAEKVMGWPLVPDGVTATAWPHVRVQDDLMWVFEGMADDWTMYSMRMFCPSEDIDAAWEVVEKMYPEWESGLDSLGYLDGTGIEGKPVVPQWRAWFWKKSPEDGTGPHIIEEAPTAPHAICLAALNAVGVEVSN